MTRHDAVQELFDQRNVALLALRAAHREEGVCSCPDDGCVLSLSWARSYLRMFDEVNP